MDFSLGLRLARIIPTPLRICGSPPLSGIFMVPGPITPPRGFGIIALLIFADGLVIDSKKLI
jgi:hypothetical protein